MGATTTALPLMTWAIVRGAPDCLLLIIPPERGGYWPSFFFFFVLVLTEVMFPDFMIIVTKVFSQTNTLPNSRKVV